MATDNLKKLQEGFWEELVDKYKNIAEDFSEKIKDEIIEKARDGYLPMQNLDLAEVTIKKRLSVGLEKAPRFWATEQLVRSIIVTCRLV